MRRAVLGALLIIGCSEHETVTLVRDAGLDPWRFDAPDPDVLDAGSCAIDDVVACPAVTGESTLYRASVGETIVGGKPPLLLVAPLRVLGVTKDALVPFVPLDPADAALRPVGMSGYSDQTHVLACDATLCRVLRLRNTGPEADRGLLRVGSELPSDTRAIANLEGTIYVAGSGVRRFDGSAWTVDRDSGRPLAAIAAGTGSDGVTVAAAGAAGLVEVFAHDTWTSISVGTDEDLVSVDLRDYSIVAAGAKGTLYLGTRSGFRACTGKPLGARTVAFANGPYTAFEGVTTDERLYSFNDSRIACTTDVLPGLRGGAYFLCGVAGNRWRWTSTELTGTLRCAID